MSATTSYGPATHEGLSGVIVNMGFCSESLKVSAWGAHACGDEQRCHHSREAAFSSVNFDRQPLIQHPLPLENNFALVVIVAHEG
jgi:hypothetical protein